MSDPNGTQEVDLFTLTSGRGLVVKIMTYGGIIQSIEAPDRSGMNSNLVLGFDNLATYLSGAYRENNQYFGAIVGRYANRIANAHFQLNGRTYKLSRNDGMHSLHGGRKGFDMCMWNAYTSMAVHSVSLMLTRVSPDGEMGYPAALAALVTYSVTDDNILMIDYRATNLDSSRSTVVNLTNHAYFNMSGEGHGDIYNHRLQINASHYAPIDEQLVPTGDISPVAETPMDFRRSSLIGDRLRSIHPQLAFGHGFDHNWVLDRSSTDDRTLLDAARVVDPGSGRQLEVATTEPGIQFYTGNFLDGSLRGSSGRALEQGAGFCLETQHFPDSPNHAAFPSTTLLPRQTYVSKTLFRFSIAGAGSLATPYETPVVA